LRKRRLPQTIANAGESVAPEAASGPQKAG